MPVLPREQVTQRHPRASVSAPGVRLWETETVLSIPTVDITDEVTDEEVELAHLPPPPTRLSFDEWGVVQGWVFGEGYFGEGPFGGLETEWDDPYRR